MHDNIVFTMHDNITFIVHDRDSHVCRDFWSWTLLIFLDHSSWDSWDLKISLNTYKWHVGLTFFFFALSSSILWWCWKFFVLHLKRVVVLEIMSLVEVTSWCSVDRHDYRWCSLRWFSGRLLKNFTVRVGLHIKIYRQNFEN